MSSVRIFVDEFDTLWVRPAQSEERKVACTEEDIDRWLRIREEYHAMQLELAELYVKQS